MPRIGYRFRPTEVELINHFLKHKMDGNDHLVDADISEIDLLQFEPWDLPSLAAVQEEVLDDQENYWHFFCKRDSFSRRPSRQTRGGQWKSTCRDRVIKDKRKEIGTKKTLRFYRGRASDGVRTNWIIHEYQPKPIPTNKRPFVLIKLIKNVVAKTDTSTCNEGEHLRQLPSDFRNHPIETPISQVDQELLSDSIDYLDFTPEEILLIRGCFDDSNVSRSPSGFNQQDNNAIELADSFIADPEEYKFGRTVTNDSYPKSSLSRVCFEGVTSGNQELQAEVFQLPETSNMQNRNASSNEYWQICTIQTTTETLPYLSDGQNRRENHVSHHYEIPLPKASSVSVATDTLREIFALEVASEESSSPGSTTDSPKDINSIELIPQDFSDYITAMSGSDKSKKGTAPTTSPFQGKSSCAVSEQLANKVTKHGTAIQLPPKKTSVSLPKKESIEMEFKSEKDSKMVLARADLKLTTNRMSSFILTETPPMGHKTSPPSVYVVNMLLGLVLFVIVSREVLICH